MNVYLIKSFSIRLLQSEIAKIIGNSANIVKMNMEENNISDIISECSYYSLLDEQKYIIVDNFKTTKENAAIEEYFNNPNPDTTLVLIAESIDKRSSIYKKISSNGVVILIEDLKDINNKINAYCKEKNISIDYLAINKLLENNLNNYDLVLNEIDKIGNLKDKITNEDVLLYSPKLAISGNFEFCDAIIKKDYQEISERLKNFIELKEEIPPFIGLLASSYRLMYTIKSLDGTNDAIAKKLDIHPYRVKLAKEKSAYYSKEELEKKLLDLCDLDYNIKTSKMDKYLLLKLFIARL